MSHFPSVSIDFEKASEFMRTNVDILKKEISEHVDSELERFYKQMKNKEDKITMWKCAIRDRGQLENDKNYLVSWKDSEGEYSRAHSAYYLYGHFFSLENNNSHPIHVDVFMEIPEVDL